MLWHGKENKMQLSKLTQCLGWWYMRQCHRQHCVHALWFAGCRWHNSTNLPEVPTLDSRCCHLELFQQALKARHRDSMLLGYLTSSLSHWKLLAHWESLFRLLRTESVWVHSCVWMLVLTYMTYMCRSVTPHHLPCLRWPLLLTSLYTDLLAYELPGFSSHLTVRALRPQVMLLHPAFIWI